jgi:hypothetical protein
LQHPRENQTTWQDQRSDELVAAVPSRRQPKQQHTDWPEERGQDDRKRRSESAEEKRKGFFLLQALLAHATCTKWERKSCLCGKVHLPVAKLILHQIEGRPNHSQPFWQRALANSYAHQIQEKLSGTNDVPPEALSAGHTKRMESEIEAFSFYPDGKSSRKTAQCCLENVCVRAIERRTIINELSEHFHANHQKLYESQKRSFIRRTTTSARANWFFYCFDVYISTT